MTYLEQSNDLVSRASVATMVFMTESYDDLELVPVWPRRYSDDEVSELFARLARRGFRSVAFAGLVGSESELVTKEPLSAHVIHGLAGAFQRYCDVLLFDRVAEHVTAAEVQELCRWWSLEDTREA
jgi:hypothetical protein